MSSSMTATRPSPTRPPRPSASGWLHLCNGLDPGRDGGMVPSILGMTGALAARGEPIRIRTTTPSRLGDARIPEGVELAGPEVEWDEALRRAGAVHVHGLWQGQTRLGGAAAARARVPYVVAAHGMAEPWAMRHKWLKKRIYTRLVEGPVLRRAGCLHALSRPEVGHLRALAPNAPVCFVPNGVALEPLADLPPRAALEAEHPELAGKFVLLFLSRIHVKKGLDLLADALGRAMPDHPDLHLLLAGKDDGALGPFRERMESAGLGGRLTWIGHVSGERARMAWGASDAFILPSHSEGFSMSVLEALACRKPSLITTACHFPELAAAGGAIVVPPTSGDVERGLRDLLERSPGQREEMAGRGHRLVASQYTWDRQAERLAAVYRWLAGGGDRPEAVFLRGEQP
jgi:glycosyltransferase involved in cell wall biosynthesis